MVLLDLIGANHSLRSLMHIVWLGFAACSQGRAFIARFQPPNRSAWSPISKVRRSTPSRLTRRSG